MLDLSEAQKMINVNAAGYLLRRNDGKHFTRRNIAATLVRDLEKAMKRPTAESWDRNMAKEVQDTLNEAKHMLALWNEYCAQHPA